MVDAASSIVETIYEDRSTSVLRLARRGGARRSVVVKVRDPRRCHPRDLAHLKHELELGPTIATPRVVKALGLETYEGMPALVLEDFGGQPLERLVGRPMSVGAFLELALRITSAVAELHDEGLVHKNLQPRSIFVNPSTDEVRLTDLEFATRLPREPCVPRSPALLEGALAYLSPEQTGWMNRAVDRRSDLYALGVIFYELLTGRRPFEAHDPLEWVHCQVARTPPSPSHRAPAVPAGLSAVVLKLLAKMAEDRYQTARGLAYDLERARARWVAARTIEPFPLGEQDASERLELPQRLYGRDAEAAALQAVLERVVARGTTEVVLISGHSGVGKSCLVHELGRSIVRAGGLFLAGKSDQYSRDVPYAPFTQAFQVAVQEVLAADEAGTTAWRARLRGALGANARLLVDLFPQLELILGPQPVGPEPSSTVDAEARFQSTFRRFVDVFASPGRPVVLFLDDLQWLDPSSLRLLAHLASSPDTYELLLIGAYRETELHPAGPLAATLQQLRAAGAQVHELELGPLSRVHVSALVNDALGSTPEASAALVDLVHEKTQGNPFFLMQFLRAIYEEGALALDVARHAWSWDLSRIRAMDVTDNVLDLVIARVARLSAEAQESLRLAAFLGDRFQLADVATIRGISSTQAGRELYEALAEGLLLRLDGTTYRFLHDRVQQAAYALVPEGGRAEVHLRIARLLFVRTPDPDLAEKAFELVGHFNQAAGLIEAEDELVDVARLNLLAGRRSMASGAHHAACGHFDLGLRLLPAGAWDSHYELAYALNFERTRCGWRCGRLEDARARLEELRLHRRGRQDEAAVTQLEVELETTRGDYAPAVDSALATFARLFGAGFPLQPSSEAVREATERTWQELGGRSIEDLRGLPVMTDPDARAAVALLVTTLPPAYMTDRNLHDLLTCHIVSLSLRHGNADGSPQGYVAFGALLGQRFERWEEAARFAEVARGLVDAPGLHVHGAIVHVAAAALIDFWVRPVRDIIPSLDQAFEEAVRSGDQNHACWAVTTGLILRFMGGEPLPEVLDAAERARAFTDRSSSEEAGGVITLIGHLARSLMGEGDVAPELPAVRTPEPWNRAVYQAALSLLQGDHERAAAAALEAAALEPGEGPPAVAEYHFYAALALAAHHDAAAPDARRDHAAAIEVHRRRHEVWERQEPSTFHPRHALIAAALAHVRGQDLEAMRLYDDAIASAREGGFVHIEALGNELAGCFYQQRGFETIAETYLLAARGCYARWGADAKVQRLDADRRPHVPRPETSSGAQDAGPQQLDVLAVVKASQAVSGELVHDELFSALMRVVMEHGGAQRGHLILIDDHGMRVVAEAEAGPMGIDVRSRAAPTLASSVLPLSVLNYVRRSRERVLLSGRLGPFASDEYLRRRHPRSLVCLPIIRKADLVGLLYLENDLIVHAFSPSRLAVLEVLAAQAAISMDNATLLARERSTRLAAELLAEAGALLAQSLDYEDTLAGLARLCVRTLADWCLVDVVVDPVRHELGRLAAAHADPAKAAALEELRRRFPPRWDSGHPAARCLRTGEPVLLEEITEGDLRAGCDDPEHAALIQALGARSAIAVRLAARGQTLGALTLVSSQRRYTPEDLALAQELARRAAISIDNAQLYRAARAAVGLRDEFLTVASHELRTPLTSLRLSVQGLLRPAAGEPTREAIRLALVRIDRQTKHLADLVETLLDVSLAEAGAFELRLEEVDLAAVARDVVELHAAVLARARVAVEVIGGPVAGRWDRARLLQVATSLLTNAVKFGAGRPIAIEVTEEAGSARMVVRDEGVGIEPLQQEHLFDRFQRGVSARHYGGLGLGLYIARKIVEAHGGSITVESQPGAGAAFTIVLPRGPATAAST